MKQINYKKLILPNIPYVFFVSLIKSDRRCGLPPARIFLQRY